MLAIITLPDFGIFSPPRHCFLPTKFKTGIAIFVHTLKVRFVPNGFPVGGAYETLYSVMGSILVREMQKAGLAFASPALERRKELLLLRLLYNLLSSLLCRRLLCCLLWSSLLCCLLSSLLWSSFLCSWLSNWLWFWLWRRT